MKNKFKNHFRNLTFVLSLVLFWQCDNEDIIVEGIQQKGIENIEPTIALEEINSHISSGNTSSRTFNNPVFNNIDYIKNAKKYISDTENIKYTFSLQNYRRDTYARTTSFQYITDNLNVQLNDDGTYSTSIFRYIPDMDWFNNPNNDITSYTGEIQLLDDNLEIISSFNITDGVPLETNTSSRNVSARGGCQIQFEEICTELIWADGSSGGLQCEVTITINCNGGSGSDDNGSDNSSNNNNDDTGGGGGSGGGSSTGTPILDTCHETNTCEEELEFDENNVIYDEGDKPLEEFNNKCNGISRIWQLSQSNGDEYAAVLTTDGAILITQQLNSNGGGISGIYNHNGTTYYQYPASQGSPSRTYAGQLNVSSRYFIPILATIHSHTPCINDGTDGITNNTINDDQTFASHYPNVNHYIIGCNAIGQFNGRNNTAFNIQNGNLSTLCNNIN